MRRPVKNRNYPKPDHVYNSEKVAKFINNVMLHGKKSTVQRDVYRAFDIMKEQAKMDDPLALFEQALQNVAPTLEVRSRRVGGANYQVPYPVRPERQVALAMRWIIGAARGKSGKTMAERLADELIAATKNEGDAMKKKDTMMKMAESNKAFAHFAFSGNKKR